MRDEEKEMCSLRNVGEEENPGSESVQFEACATSQLDMNSDSLCQTLGESVTL